jgi:hypothetical protein
MDLGAAAAGHPGASGGGRKLLAAFAITERKGFDKPFWNRVGTAFHNRDGSINIYLDALPLQGKLQLREETQRDKERSDSGRRRDAQHDEE